MKMAELLPLLKFLFTWNSVCPLFIDMTERAGEKLSMVQALEKEIEHCLKKEEIILPRS